jgi:DNA-binding NtrC family response regulator
MSGEARLPRLVVVDDDELVRTWLCETLALEGYAVEAAADGAEALQRAEEFDPAVVLLDLRLPDEYGIDLVSKIHEIDRDIIVVIVTAFGDIETAVQAVKAGAYDYLEKPIDFEKLLIVVGRACASSTDGASRTWRSWDARSPYRISPVWSTRWRLPTPQPCCWKGRAERGKT